MTDRPGNITPPSVFTARLVAGAALLIACLGALITLAAYQSRLRYEETAQTATQNLARVLDAAIAGAVDKANLALLHVSDEHARQRAQPAFDSEAMEAMIAVEKRHHRELEDLHLTDAQGKVLFGAGARQGQPLSVADRPYFIRLRQAPGLGLVLSQPLRSRLSNQLVVVLARALAGPDGSFEGVAAANIAVDELTRTLKELDVGERGYIALCGEELGIIARYPAAAPGTAAESPASPQLRELVAAGRRDGFLRVITPADGVERFASYRRVRDYPLHIVVGLAAVDYLHEWRTETLVSILLGALLAALTLALAWLLHHARRRELATLDVLRKQARSDFLTDLNNRRCFLELAEAELARTVRYGGALSMLMIDIDRFKAINDEHGHKGGDRVLQALACVFRETLREVDIVGRIGGEEFAVLLPATDSPQAAEVAERLRQIIAAAEVRLDDGASQHFTVSIGIASLEEREASIDSLLSLADTAMYQAKQTGRNRVCAA